MGCSILKFGILFLILLSACTVSSPTGNVVYLPEGEVVFVEKASFPEKYIPPLNISKKSDNNEVSCIPLGCDSHNQLVADRNARYFFPCDCEAAREIPLDNVVCLRSFYDAFEVGYSRSPKC